MITTVNSDTSVIRLLSLTITAKLAKGTIFQAIPHAHPHPRTTTVHKFGYNNTNKDVKMKNAIFKK